MGIEISTFTPETRMLTASPIEAQTSLIAKFHLKPEQDSFGQVK